MSYSGSTTAAGLVLLVTAIAAPVHASPQQPGLRTFTIEKPAAEIAETDRQMALAAPLSNLPKSTDTLLSTVGVGYVQGADWGVTLQSAGSVAGLQVQLDSLVTNGVRGAVFDRGSLLVSDPDRGWRAEAGDVFSGLRGVSRGARLSWNSRGGRQPALAVYTPSPGSFRRPTVVAYRDQLVLWSQRVLDAEVASDRSHLVLGHVTVGALSIDASFRHLMAPHVVVDKGLQTSLSLRRHVTLTAGAIRSVEDQHRTDWFMAGIRLRLARNIEIGFEHSKMIASGAESASTSFVGSGRAGNLQLFHRFQLGSTDLFSEGPESRVSREQLQSVAAYTTGSRINLTLQLATDWNASGRAQQWEELQTTVRLSRSTVLQAVTAVPDVTNRERLRVRLVQNLPQHYAIEAEFGRQSPFQDAPIDLDRPRLRVMLNKQLRVPTPASGGDLRGHVVDHAGHPVAGARITLGPYSAESNADGVYHFGYLPAGQYDLALDAAFLPADYAWDGAGRRLSVTRATRQTIDLLVAPLNVIHGRVYCDRNNNGRFDDGEGVLGAVVRLQERVTATDRDGAYHFYNVWPGDYVAQLDGEHLPAPFVQSTVAARSLTLGDAAPVVGADFTVVEKTKPIIWKEIK